MKSFGGQMVSEAPQAAPSSKRGSPGSTLQQDHGPVAGFAYWHREECEDILITGSEKRSHLSWRSSRH
jgi:hypothetical protein